MSELIEIATSSARSGTLDVDSMVSRAVAIFYLEQVLWFEPRDPFRALGLSPSASYDEVTENAHRLMKWLHPYMGGERREAAFGARVLEAWEVLAPDDDEADAVITQGDRPVVEHSKPEMSTIEEPGDERRAALPKASRRWMTRWWRVAPMVLIALVAIGVAAVGVRMVLGGGGDSPKAGGIVPAAMQIVPRTQP